jgi:hypothetical protein
MPRVLMSCLCLPLAFGSVPGIAMDSAQKLRYLRPAGLQFVSECEFTLTRGENGSTIESVTQRGPVKLTVTARYDAKDLLRAAEVTLLMKDQKKTAAVSVVAGKARVLRDAQAAQEFDAPKGVIVTSAPDWTDTFLLCRRYDRDKGGKQQFAGLWIHPVEHSQRLTFAIERHGAEMIEHAGKKLKLDRYTIWLRGNSSYAAWADADGKMIKLVPLPFNENAMNWLVLEGYEKSAAGLPPKEKR